MRPDGIGLSSATGKYQGSPATRCDEGRLPPPRVGAPHRPVISVCELAGPCAKQPQRMKRKVWGWLAILVAMLSAVACNQNDAGTTTAIPVERSPEDVCLSTAPDDYRDRVFTTLVNLHNFGIRVEQADPDIKAIVCLGIKEGGALNEGYAGMDAIDARIQGAQPPPGCEGLHATITKASKAMREALRICGRLQDAFTCRTMRTADCVDTDLMAELFSIATEQAGMLERQTSARYHAWLDQKANARDSHERERAEKYLTGR
jgi:hypothetical protein